MRPLATLKTAALGLLAATAPVFAQTPTETLSGVITGTVTLDANEVYLIDGEVFVDNGATLNIPAGTILKGKREPSEGNGEASVLVVQRGGTINATGTSDAPVIFTAEDDDVSDAFDTNESQRGLWGGVILLGNATNNRGERSIEGLTPDNPRVLFGPGEGFPVDDDDDSGVMRYVSIRHAGYTRNPNEEINGLTFGAVGRGTTIEYVEVFANSDDSFEFFGGTVNAKYLVGAFSGDDDFDWDQGYTGKLQFLFSIKDESGDVGRCIEGDGGAAPFTATPLSSPIVSNMTCVGSGVGSTPGGSDAGGPTLKLRENTGGFIYNSVFTAYETSNGGIDLETQPTDDDGNPLGATDGSVSTEQNFFDEELDIRNNVFADYSTGNTAAAIVRRDNATLETALSERNTFAESAELMNVADGSGEFDDARDQDGALDPRPMEGGVSASGASFSIGLLDDDSDDDDDAADGGFFRTVDYLGAFAPGEAVWASGWTALATMEYLSGIATPVAGGPEAAAFALTVGPNPASAAATVRFSLDRGQDVRLALYDVLGREVALVAQGAYGAGEQTARLDVAQLPAGVYVLRLQGEGAAASRQISVVR